MKDGNLSTSICLWWHATKTSIAERIQYCWNKCAYHVYRGLDTRYMAFFASAASSRSILLTWSRWAFGFFYLSGFVTHLQGDFSRFNFFIHWLTSVHQAFRNNTNGGTRFFLGTNSKDLFRETIFHNQVSQAASTPLFYERRFRVSWFLNTLFQIRHCAHRSH